MLLSSSDVAPNMPAALRDLPGRLRAVPPNDPVAALAEIGDVLDALVAQAQSQFMVLAVGLGELDEASQPYLRASLRGFLQAAVLKSGRGEVLRSSCLAFFRQLSGACAEALQRGRYEHTDQSPLLAELAARLLRAETNALKWDHMVYGPYDEGLWRRTGAVLLEAVEEGREALPVRLRSDRETVTTTGREMARAIALRCGGLDQLPVELIDITDRMIHYILPALYIGPMPVEGARFYWQPHEGRGPVRLVSGQENVPNAWYFSAQHADPAMAELERMLAKGMVPGVLDSGPGSREKIRACMRHLRRAWCEAPVTRRHRRHPMTGGIRALKGFGTLRQVLKNGAREWEQWDLRDASVNGMGVVMPLASSELPRIGDLVAVRPDETGEWRLGMIRRLTRDEGLKAYLGLETFATAPRVVRADDGRAPIDVLLCDPLRRGGVLRIVSPTNALRPGSPLFVAENGAIQKLKPLGSAWRGSEFEVRTYLVL
ncbi:hypothetical protein G3580_15520 [Nitrogeniibacter mangrovi]|uniref:PilZ domain-containing protein n=1 Tax=Nitrogeniibacter mangrovi TaxID=2016596 RepID=A0A6C1B9I0_9RHOO|nr:hypothetical protein [Nitrogeniibacter mangrovi]QID18904.1 hypothetical protein G3580_15520 [Nitrogeniibacter mangrovi]